MLLLRGLRRDHKHGYRRTVEHTLGYTAHHPPLHTHSPMSGDGDHITSPRANRSRSDLNHRAANIRMANDSLLDCDRTPLKFVFHQVVTHCSQISGSLLHHMLMQITSPLHLPARSTGTSLAWRSNWNRHNPRETK